MLKIEFCYKCKNYSCVYSHDIEVVRIICKHSAWAKRKNKGRIINKKLAMKGEIPGWCKLEDYPGGSAYL